MAINNTSWRVSVRTALIIEVVTILFFILIGYLAYPYWKDIWIAPTMMFIYLLMCTAPLAHLKGFDFSLHDLDEAFPWIHYHFLSIFVAAFTAPFFNTTIYAVIGEIKFG
jgi:hypothetical protein